MARKIGERPTVRLPTFEVPKSSQTVTDKFPGHRPWAPSAPGAPAPSGSNTFAPGAGQGPMVMPRPAVNPASIPGYGTPAALDDVMKELSTLPGLQGGVTREAREAAVAQARDTLIAVGRERGLDLMLNRKANGQLSLDAFAWRKPDGSVAVIDFALASKDLSRPTQFQWLDVTGGGGARASSGWDDLWDYFFWKNLKEWAEKPGWAAGSSGGDRQALLGMMKGQLLQAGAAAGMKLEPHFGPDGVESPDKLVWTKPDGTQEVVQFVKNASDLTRALEVSWPPPGAPAAAAK